MFQNQQNNNSGSGYQGGQNNDPRYQNGQNNNINSGIPDIRTGKTIIMAPDIRADKTI